MFWPFALLAAVRCGRKRFRPCVGNVVSFWILLAIFGVTTHFAWTIVGHITESWVESWFISVNVFGGLSMLFRMVLLALLLKDGAKGKSQVDLRSLGRTMGGMRWLPLCGFARDVQDEQARFEPLACFLNAIYWLALLNIYAWVLLVGSIALAVYEAREQRREMEEAQETLAQLQKRISVTEGTVRTLLITARAVVDELHVVAAIEADEDPESPIAQRIDDLIRETCDRYPALEPDMYRATIDAPPDVRIAAYALEQGKRPADSRPQLH